MFRNGLGLRSRARVLGVSKRAWPARWQMAWLVALVAVGMAAGVSVAAGDPDWEGTEPEHISVGMSTALRPAASAGPSGRIVVAWSGQESDEDLWDIFVRHSDDDGHTWSAPEVISGTAHESALPDVRVVGNQAFVAWVDQKTRGGENITIYEAEVGATGARHISSPTPLSLASTRPRLSAGAGRLHVVFNAGANILHAMRPLAATAWPTAARVYTSTSAFAPWFHMFPMVATGPDGETLHVVWQEQDIGKWTIMYMGGKLNGDQVDWEPARILFLSATEVFYPAIDADSAGNLHIVWNEAISAVGHREHYVRYTRCGAAGDECLSPAIRVDDAPVRINEDSPTFATPSLALLEREGRTEVCVAWHGFREGELSEDVRLSCSLDQGQSWSAPQNVSRSTDTEGISVAPSIVFDAFGRLHSVWHEHTAAMGPSIIYDCQVYHSYALSKVFLSFVARY